MRQSQSLIAKKFAKAYLLEFGDQLSVKDIDNIKLAILFFRKNHNFISLVSVVVTTYKKNQILINEIISHFSLHETLKKLVTVLVRHKSLVYFSQVLQDVCCMYQSKKGILEVDIYSATELTNDEKIKLEIFFANLSGKEIIGRVIIDESLIAGVRMQSELFMWEYSIAARLRKLRQKMFIEG